MLNKKFKKAISAVTMFATVVCLSGVSMLAPLAASAAEIVDGDIIKSNATNSDGTPTLGSLDVYIVKIVGTKKFKRLVLNPQVFASYGHLKWENIKTVSQAEEDSYVTSSLVRVDGDAAQKVYALTPAGDTGAKSWVNVSSSDFLSVSQSDPESIYTINSVDAGNYATKADITTVTQLKAFYKDGTLPAESASGDLTVSLSAATPEAMNIPVGASAEFADIKLAAGSTAVSINSITVTASGYGDSDNIDNVALYIDGAKLAASKNINSEKEATFNFSTPVKISANASKTLVIKASASAAGTYKLGIKESADIITAGGSVAGSFPIYGNGMAADANVTTGTVLMNNVETDDSTNSFGEDNVLLAAFDLKANNESAIVDSFRFKNGGTNEEDIISNLKLIIDGDEVADGAYDASTGYITFAVDGDYKIEKDETASVEVRGDLGTATAGDTIKFYVKNIDDFAFTGEDYGFGVQLTAIDAAIDAAGDAITVTFKTGDVSIDMDKAVTPAKDVKADTDNVVLATFSVTSNGEDATLEQIVNDTANSKFFQIQGTGLETAEVENVEMRDIETGAIYDLTSTFVGGAYELSLTDEVSLVKGKEKTFEIRADLTSAIDETDTLKVVVDGDAMTITGDISDSAITDITPASVTSAIATVKVASLDWTTTALTAKTVAPNASDIVIYQATVEAGTTDAVKLSTVKLITKTAQADSFTDSNISKIDLYLNGKLIKKSLSNGINEGAAATKGTVTFSSLITTDDANVIPAGEAVTLEAKATFASNLTDTADFALAADAGIIARTVSGNEIVAENITSTDGSRTIAIATEGTLKVELLTSSTKADDDTLLLAGTATPADKYLGELKFTTANEKIKVTEIRLEDNGTATSSDIAEVQLVDSTGAVVATKTPGATGNVTFTGLSLELPADKATSYFIAVKAKGMNVDGDATATATQGHTVQYNISATDGIVARGVDSGLDISLEVNDGTAVAPKTAGVDAGEWSAAAVVSKTTTVSGAVLNTITNAMTDGTLTGGLAKTIAKYTLVFENGSNQTTDNEELKAVLDGLKLTVSKSATVSLANVKAYLEGTSTKVAADDAVGSTTWTSTLDGLADSGKVDGSVTIVIVADVTTTGDNDYLQTSIAAANTDLDYTVAGSAVANNYLSIEDVVGATLSK